MQESCASGVHLGLQVNKAAHPTAFIDVLSPVIFGKLVLKADKSEAYQESEDSSETKETEPDFTYETKMCITEVSEILKL